MQGDSTKIYSTIALDREGNIVEVRNRDGKAVPEESHGRRKVGDDCPEGKTKIKVIKTIEIEYITCEDTSDPCWVHSSACRWYKVC